MKNVSAIFTGVHVPPLLKALDLPLWSDNKAWR